MNEQIEAVRRMQKYIDGHLHEMITPADLAAVSLFSPWHARRLFEQYTGMSPARYIRRLKLSESALRLRDESCKVLDVAMDLGFGSVDGYQRAFRNEFGLNPKEYADHPVPIWLFVPYPIESKGSERSGHMEAVRNIFIQLVSKPARKVIIKRGVKAGNYWDYSMEVGCGVWGLLTSIPAISGEPVCLWLPEHLRSPRENVYVQGAAEKKYDPSPIGYAWDNTNPRIQLEPIGSRGYIELAPVRKIP